MNQGIAISKFQRSSTRKLRLVADEVRGMDAEKALVRLQFVRSRANGPLAKAIRQAVANAKQVGLSAPFMISQLCVDKGPIYKRWQPVSRGQPHSIHKPTSHIKVMVSSAHSAPSEVNKKPSLVKRVAQRVTGKPAGVETMPKAPVVKPEIRESKPMAVRSKPVIQRKALPK